MSWPAGTVPADVSALRDMIGASATWVAAGGVSGHVHYPTADLTALVLPAAVITRETNERTSYAAGSGALPAGSFRIDFYVAGGLAGDAEDFANKLAQEIAAQPTGLLIKSCRADLASDTDPAEKAAIADGDSVSYCVVPVYIQHGISL